MAQKQVERRERAAKYDLKQILKSTESTVNPNWYNRWLHTVQEEGCQEGSQLFYIVRPGENWERTEDFQKIWEISLDVHQSDQEETE